MGKLVENEISAATAEAFAVETCQALGGGCINSAYSVEGGARRFFVKINRASSLGTFEAEAEGLREIAAAGAIRVPHPVCTGIAGDSAFLVLEYLDLGAGDKGGRKNWGAGWLRCTG